MLFSSMIFLWLFLPFVLVVNLVLPIRLSSFFLLAMSFIFLCMGRAGVYMASPFVPDCELCRRFGDGGCSGQQAGGWSRPGGNWNWGGRGRARGDWSWGSGRPGRRRLGLGRLGPEPQGKLLERQGVTAGAAVSTASQTASGAGSTLSLPRISCSLCW